MVESCKKFETVTVIWDSSRMGYDAVQTAHLTPVNDFCCIPKMASRSWRGHTVDIALPRRNSNLWVKEMGDHDCNFHKRQSAQKL
jgi:hypothetical protein